MKYGLMTVVAALLILLSSPVWALTQDEAQQMVKSVGCTADVYSVDSFDFNAYYDSGNHVIVVIGFDRLPESWQRFILWHETGHCMQFQERRYGSLRASGVYELEWDADAYAIQRLAEEGVDGAAINEDIWAVLYLQYGFKGHKWDSHGTSVDRITRGNLNRVQRSIQSFR